MSDFDQAALIASELAEDGVKAIELCAGFAGEGAKMVIEAVQGKAKVGVVYFTE